MTEDWRKRDPSWNRRYPLPFEEHIEGKAQVHYAAELKQCTILAPDGDVVIGASHLEQCVIVEPCHIGDNVKAVGAILQGHIDDDVTIEAHADIRGTVQDGCTIRRGVVIDQDAFVGPNTEIGDMTIVNTDAEIGAGCVIGPQSTIGEHAFVKDGARLPARSVVRPGGHVVEAAAIDRLRDAGGERDDRVGFRIVDALNEDDAGPPDDDD